MNTAIPSSVDDLAEYLIGYIAKQYPDTKHVRRVGPWLGFILKAIERVATGTLELNRTRQIVFSYRGRQFKARYDHHAGFRGGIELVEFLPLQGSPDASSAAVRVTNLDEAERVYQSLEQQLDAYIDR
jgi:hypothetical protein